MIGLCAELRCWVRRFISATEVYFFGPFPGLGPDSLYKDGGKYGSEGRGTDVDELCLNIRCSNSAAEIRLETDERLFTEAQRIGSLFKLELFSCFGITTC